MKLKVKANRDKIAIEVTTDTAKKPFVGEFTREQIQALIAVLSTATKAESFAFEFEG